MAMARNGTPPVTDLLQASEQLSRAQERIDSDPEQARDILERHVPRGARQRPLQDVLGLFMQMQQAQQQMQGQIVELLTRQGQQRSVAHTQEDIKIAQEQQRLTLEAWKTEPRLPVYLEPSFDEQKIFAVMGEYPPRVHR